MQTTPMRRHWLFPLLLALGVALVACDDGDSRIEADSSATDTAETDTEADTTTTPDNTDPPDETTSSTDVSDPDQTDADAVVLDDRRIPGLSAPVQVAYDEHGIAHLQCATDEDCAAAMGYVHASNRFFFMDFVRLAMRAQLGTAVPLGDDIGAALLDADTARRTFFTAPDGRPLEEVMVDQIEPELETLAQRYADGVNTWLDDARNGRNGAVLSGEYNLNILYPNAASPTARAGLIRNWEIADSMAIALSLYDDLANTAGQEIGLGSSVATLATFDATLASDVFSLRPVFPVATMPASGEMFGLLDGIVMPIEARVRLIEENLERFTDRIELLERAKGFADGLTNGFGQGGETGSNNWVLAPERTADGRALLANDPHLALSNPPIWFPASMDSKTGAGATGTIHCAGGTMAGLPIFLSGVCEDVAWGVTTAYYDITDVYLESLNATNDAVTFEGNEVPIAVYPTTISNAGADVTIDIEVVPHHGPILVKDEANNTAISARWALHNGNGAKDLTGFLELMRASTVAEAQTALGNIHGANQNFVVMDSAGDIGWFPYIRVPVRPWDWSTYPPYLPLPGDGSAEWDGFFAVEDLPQMINPTNGFIATANQDHTGAYIDGMPDENNGIAQIYGRAGGTRMQRIVDLIEAGGNGHTPDSMLSIQSDTFSLLGEIVAPEMVAAAAGATLSPEASAVVSALENWDYTCPTGLATSDPAGAASTDAAELAAAQGCAAFHVAYFELMSLAVGDEATAAGTGISRGSATTMIIEYLERPGDLATGGSFWDDVATVPDIESADDIMLQAIGAAATRLSAATDASPPGLGADPANWLWGRIHTISLASPFANFDFDGFNEGPYANDGGYLTVDVANPVGFRGNAMPHTNGASIRTVIEFQSDGPHMFFQLPGGTSLDRGSDRYNQLMARWLNNDPLEFYFGYSAVTAPVESFEIQAPE